MAESTVQLPADGTGKSLRTLTNPGVAGGAHQEVVTLALPDGTLADPATQTTLAAVLARLLATLTVGGSVSVSNLPATQPVSGTVTVANPTAQGLTDTQLRASKVVVADDYQAGEVLPDQAGAGAVLTFTFSAAVQLVVVHARGATARADPFGGPPSASQGIVCGDDIPTYVPVLTSSVKVFAPAGCTVTVYGMRRT